jgi:hypothetical protein
MAITGFKCKRRAACHLNHFGSGNPRVFRSATLM